MLLKTLKSNSLGNLIFIPFAVLAFWFEKFLSPYNYGFMPGEADNVLFAPIFRLTEQSPLLNVVLSAVLTMVLALLVEMIIARYQFIRIRTRLPAILFIIIVGGFTGLHTLLPVYFAAIFLLVAIFRLFGIFEQSKAYTIAFDVGVLLGVGSLFYFNMVVFLPAFIVGLLVLNRDTRWREIVLIIIGFLLPLIFAGSYFFFTGRLISLLQIFQQSIMEPVNHFRTNIPLQVYLGVLVVFTVLGSIVMAQQYDTKKVSSRKYFTVFFFVFVFSLGGFVLIPAASHEMLILTAIPVTYLISNFLVFMKSRFWSEFFFLLLLGIVIALQIFG
ncbi:DUF6427 family protein [Maribellus sp. YY47]|uniref:DUF6427 family protein n=1 Tax=Maribellus sp. YY47 TaxID=2929486 RepID=UPI0020013FE7|nr:DUF6427 family protein [Maribellus sp. YY47]MCK3686208.1 DUF6427 family protein [Maribellus sp. YY47]